MQKKENQIELSIHKPFGPRILEAQLPYPMVQSLNKVCDDIIKSKKKRKELDKHDTLVGHVTEELICDFENPKLENFGNFLTNATRVLYEQYVIEKHGEIGETNKVKHMLINDAWFVRSFEYDYNPTHIHTNCTFSCVAYLKVPKTIKDKNHRNKRERYVTEGRIDFIYGGNSVCCPSNFVIKPKVGNIYIFPSDLMHSVYPFFGDGERRSFSANMSFIFHGQQEREKEEKEKIMSKLK